MKIIIIILMSLNFTSCASKIGGKLFGSKDLAEKAEAKVVKQHLMKDSLIYGYKYEDWIKNFGQPEQQLIKGDYLLMQYRQSNFGPDKLIYVAFHRKEMILHQWETSKDYEQQQSYGYALQGFNEGIQNINNGNEQRAQERQEYLDNFYKESARKREIQQMKRSTCITKSGYNGELITECN